MKKLKAVFYARVSTDHSDQLHSLKAQQDYFYQYLDNHPEFELVNSYVDEGITGTSIKKRKSFQKMINDALHHHFDIILTKEVTRFARNTLDTLQMVRLLKENNVNVLFLTDMIDTRTHEGELRLSLMATIAQEEGRKISQRVNWGFQRAFENEKLVITNVYGYDIVKVGHVRKLEVNEQQAYVIQHIFKWYLQGLGYGKISKRLYEWNIPSPSGNAHWDTSVIAKILANEKYIGRLVQGKQKTNNYLEKKILRNISRNDMYITNNHHEAIVDKEIFYAVQQLRQSKVKNGERNRRYPLSGKVICAMCRKSYARMKYGNSIGWGCRKCENTNIINETVLIELLRSFISTVFINKEKVKKELVDALMNSYDFMNCENQINQLHKDIAYIRRRMKLYLDDYLEEKISIEVYKENKLKEEKELEAKEKELQALEMKESNNDMKNAIHHIVKVIEKKVEIDKGVIHQIIIQYIKAIIPKKMNEYHLYMDLSDFYFKENVDLSQFEYVKTYIFDLQDYQSPYVKKKYKQLQNTKLHLYIRRLSL
ncbi:recombinase family protein [Faecalibacillus faecis]|uniref:recombinase family protein n=1 Tax=Faecalibacillus faecis TaxID=1982628 RepID=UPI0018A987EF|nr:recombinase family protein [Faecalibacillus faecis]